MWFDELHWNSYQYANQVYFVFFSCGVTKFSRMNINASQKMRLRKLVGQTMSLCEICDGPAGKKLPPFAVEQ